MNYYKPKNKKEREARRMVFDRFHAMRDDDKRKEAEQQWDMGDKMFAQWVEPLQEGDTRSNIALPDGFAAVQTHMQETIDRRSRPRLKPVGSDDNAIEMFGNAILNYSMEMTGYDYQDYLAKQTAAIRGTSFVMEYYRVDKRKIQDPVGVDEETGELEYEEKEVVDFDDAYTEWVDNEFIFFDPGTSDQNDLRDMVYREILDYDEFKQKYEMLPGFMNIDKVPKAGLVNDQAKYFERPRDMTDDEVEILHYYNRLIDAYYVLANNVLIRMSPLPSKHKELPLAVHVHYNVPGQIYGLGIPKTIYSLTEERRSLRNLNVDRNNLHINKMFLVNDLVDLDEEDARSRPHGLIPVNTNGLRLNEVIQPLEYGDTPVSYYRTEEMLLEDIRRAHGIDDRLQGVSQAGTATEAAILKEASQRRINLINTLSEMNTVIRIGRLKWSNIQFFYPAKKVEKITEDNEERLKKDYRTIRSDGMVFKIQDNPGTGKKELKYDEIDGSSSFKMNKKFASFMNNQQWDVVMGADTNGVLSRPLKQAKVTEMFNLIALNPQLAASIDPDKSVKRYLEINEEDPKQWMRNSGKTSADWQRMALHENIVMAQGQMLSPTEGATEEHTSIHLEYMNSAEYQELVAQNPAIEEIFESHAFGEHEKNPNTQGSIGDMLGDEGGGEGGANPEAAAAQMIAGGGVEQGGDAAPVDIQPNFQ